MEAALPRITLGGARRVNADNIKVRLTLDSGKDMELVLTVGVASSFAGRVIAALASKPDDRVSVEGSIMHVQV